MNSLAACHEATGATGPELETQVFCICYLRAALAGDEAIAAYFQVRMRRSWERWQGGK